MRLRRLRRRSCQKTKTPPPRERERGVTGRSVTLRLNHLRGYHECSRPAFIGGLDFRRSHSKTQTDLPCTKIRSRTADDCPQIPRRGAGCQPRQSIHASRVFGGHYPNMSVAAASESGEILPPPSHGCPGGSRSRSHSQASGGRPRLGRCAAPPARQRSPSQPEGCLCFPAENLSESGCS